MMCLNLSRMILMYDWYWFWWTNDLDEWLMLMYGWSWYMIDFDEWLTVMNDWSWRLIDWWLMVNDGRWWEMIKNGLNRKLIIYCCKLYLSFIDWSIHDWFMYLLIHWFLDPFIIGLFLYPWIHWFICWLICLFGWWLVIF